MQINKQKRGLNRPKTEEICLTFCRKLIFHLFKISKSPKEAKKRKSKVRVSKSFHGNLCNIHEI